MTLPLIAPPNPNTRYAPASALEIPAFTRPNRKGQLTGSLLCESEQPGPCEVEATVTAPNAGQTLVPKRSFSTHPGDAVLFSLTLTPAARRLLARDGTLNAKISTVTKSGTSAPTTTRFPLTIEQAPPRRHKHRAIRRHH